ncbi:tripartite tricarboxylate transporter TctB family protein [Azospirillum doebereinerae]|uniref:Tripartite tricarboxylate transporter TctB family protein n=1 Tax=Azospirillum doebereinerae TaxID=92933 RepID=A0A433J475_9PROT|nr:tripartite tricarboxylate transporter TctB family protein [Azospirillum doebereinerae]MCG5238354.1 tripartite tricarboxylate transporter TctB family protein [Azospirillum doebereinerae]RUQ66765.1 tripartite tricarboxylate transporter TctB family protein [Azospirillum doebereinerae]
MSHSPEGAPGAGAPRSADIAAGIIVAVVAVAAIAVSRDFPTTGLDSDVGPARFPLIYAGILIVLSAILVIGRLLPTRRNQERAAEPAQPGTGFRFAPVAIGVVATAVYIYLISLIGYLPTTVVFLIGMMRLMGQRSWVRTPLLAVGITAFLYLIFLYGLQIPLPVGSLFEAAEL